jgi:hypothetical protein
MKTRHILVRLLLALTLLVSQQMAMAHVVSHLSGSHTDSSGKQIAADQFCGDCLSAAQLGSAAVDSVAPNALDTGFAPPHVLQVAHLFLSGTTCVFQSRAPPL